MKDSNLKHKFGLILLLYLLIRSFCALFAARGMPLTGIPFKLELLLDYFILVLLFRFSSFVTLLVGCIVLVLGSLTSLWSQVWSDLLFGTSYMILLLGVMHACYEVHKQGSNS